MCFNAHITELRNIIHNRLFPFIDNNYTLYELLFYNNVGYLLIGEGENHFLLSTKYKMVGCCSIFTYQ